MLKKVVGASVEFQHCCSINKGYFFLMGVSDLVFGSNFSFLSKNSILENCDVLLGSFSILKLCQADDAAGIFARRVHQP